MRIKLAFAALSGLAFLNIASGPVWAACINPPLSPERISSFKANPGAVVPSTNPDTRSVEAETRDLAGTDGTLAADIVRVAENQAPRFRTAIAAGLAQAALACSGTDPVAAQQIQEAVAAFQDGQFQASFAAVAGDLSTAATEAAAAFAAGGVGSVVINNPNVSTATSASSPQGSATRVPVRGVFAASGPTILSDAGTTASTPVSPTR